MHCVAFPLSLGVSSAKRYSGERGLATEGSPCGRGGDGTSPPFSIAMGKGGQGDRGFNYSLANRTRITANRIITPPTIWIIVIRSSRRKYASTAVSAGSAVASRLAVLAGR